MFTKRNLLILVGKNLVIALVSIALTSVVAAILVAQISKMSDVVVQNRRLATALEKRTELFAALKRDTEIVGQGDKMIEQAFPPADNILEFVAALESIATKNSITQQFHFNSPEPAPQNGPFPLATIAYQNDLSTNIFVFLNYLKDLERLPYFTKIESISLQSSDPLGWRSASNVSIRARITTKASQ